MSDSLEQPFTFPWYQKGLSFGCTQCGKCCTGAPGFIWISEKEMELMAKSLDIPLPTFKRLYAKRRDNRWSLVEKKIEGKHSCVFYQDKRCQVYANRPLQCRTYPFWQENLLTEKTWQMTAKECEGIRSDAPVVSQESIDEMVDLQKQDHPQEHYVALPLDDIYH